MTSDLQALRDGYRARKAELFAAIGASGNSTRGVRRSLQQLAQLADGVLRRLWADAGFGKPFALVAVGGFGRGELFPHSDIDVLVLLPSGHSPDAEPELKARIESFIGACWDAGMEIGSSVRTLEDCLAEA
ncbi:MAG: bifunctional uridylyltransferase/uridylyl-removing protein, partial [Rubrivivax sp.]